MEMEQSAQVVAKKLWKVVLYMIKTGFAKSKLMVDLDLLLKRSNKAITNLFFHRLHHHHHHFHHHRHVGRGLYSSLTCRSEADVNPSTLIRDYEFSCSNSPAYPLAASYPHKRKQHHHHNRGDVTTVAAVQRVLEMLSNNSEVGGGLSMVESPLVMLPGFGRQSPAVRQLRVTDSPFPLKEEDVGGDMVDKAAEEFIKRFYKDLKLQKKMAAALESPYRDMWDR